MTDVLASEWLKLRSVQSTVYLLFSVGAVVLLSALLAWQLVGAWDAAAPERRASLQTYRPEQGLLLFVQLFLAVLGVLAVTAEYATGTIRASLAAVPQRGVLLAAKALVVGAVAFTVGQVAVLAMWLISRLVIGDRPIPIAMSSVSEELPMLFSLGLSVMVVALVGLGFGVVTRSTTGALTAVVALLFVVPLMGRLLPAPWDARFLAVTLSQLPEQLAGAPDAFLSPLGALAAMAVYVAAALAAAAVMLRRRDT